MSRARPPEAHAMGALTHAQTQIWVGQRLHPDSPLYNMAFAFVFPGELCPDRFQRAWQRVVDDSEALRTSVTEQDGAALRRIRPEGSCCTSLLDLRSEANPQDAFLRWARELSVGERVVHVCDRIF